MRLVWYAEGRQFPDTLSSENRVLSDKVYDERDTKRGRARKCLPLFIPVEQ
jgi:hypothetical protein